MLLTNGWDTPARRAAAEKFHFDWQQHDARHQPLFPEYERGRLTLDEYLSETVFFQQRDFTTDEFKQFMNACSRELPESRAVADHLARSQNYLMAALNNEGRELNEFRISAFDLPRTLSLFFSSCYVGLRKPDPAIYRLALDVSQRCGSQGIFIDDRPENVEGARQAGLNGIRFESASQLVAELAKFGVEVLSA